MPNSPEDHPELFSLSNPHPSPAPQPKKKAAAKKKAPKKKAAAKKKVSKKKAATKQAKWELAVQQQIQEIPDELWATLFAEAEMLWDAEPWVDLVNLDHFAFSEPATGDAIVAGFLGNGGQIYGMNVYIGNEGLAMVRSLFPMAEEIGLEEDGEFFDMLGSIIGRGHVIMMEFNRNPDADRLEKELARRFGWPVKGMVPTFRSIRPNKSIGVIDRREAEILRLAFAASRHFAGWARSDAAYLDRDDVRRMPHYTYLGKPGEEGDADAWTCEMGGIPPFDFDKVAAEPLDPEIRRDLVAFPLKKGTALAADAFSPGVVVGTGKRSPLNRLAVPCLGLVVDSHGLVAGMGMPEEDAECAAAYRAHCVLDALASAILTAKIRPEKLIVVDVLLHAALAPALAELGIEGTIQEPPEGLVDAADSVTRQFSGMGGMFG